MGVSICILSFLIQFKDQSAVKINDAIIETHALAFSLSKELIRFLTKIRLKPHLGKRVSS